ncbi:MAG: AtaL-like protein [Candidatus Nitrosotenuis sp.]
MTISHSEKINCTENQLWQLLLEKITNPEYTIKEVSKSKILESFSDGYLREMIVSGMHIVERIIVSSETKEIIFNLVDNMEFDGYIINKIENKNDDVILTYLQEWKPKNSSIQYSQNQFLITIKNSVLAMKKLAEKNL